MSFQKSSICLSKKIAKEVAEDIVKITGIPLIKDLGRYLGSTSLHGRIKQAYFQQLLDLLNRKMESWKPKSLSLAGRHVLVQAVLSSILTYLMQTMSFPVEVCD